MKRFFIILITITTILVTLTGCRSNANSIIGTWTVDGYNIDGEVVSPETAVEWIGKSFAANNDTKLVFQSSGQITIGISKIPSIRYVR